MTDIIINNVLKIEIVELEKWSSKYSGEYYSCKIMITYDTYDIHENKWNKQRTELLMFSHHTTEKDKTSYNFSDITELPQVEEKETSDY